MAQEGGIQDRADEERSWLILNEPDEREIEEAERYEESRRQPDDEVSG